MQSTQPSSDEWSDDAIKTLLEYGGWKLHWSAFDEGWVATPPGLAIGAVFSTLAGVHEYFLNHSKWYHDDGPDISKS
jgi:hypothetical protein